jgi:methanogenic corrinoid protein MtbC1
MPTTPHAFAAELLRASGRALAGVAAARLLQDDPQLAERYGPGAFDLWRAHIAAQLADLATAIEESDPTVFVRQLRWFRAALTSRELPQADVGLSLRAIEATLRERTPQIAPSLWDTFFTAAARSLESAAAEASPPEFDADSAASSFFVLTLAGRSREARAAAVQLVASGRMGAEELVERVLLPVEREAGRRWHLGQLTVAEEHIVTSVIRTAMADLSAAAPVPAPTAPGAVIAAVAGDSHDTALHALAALLEYDGWRVSVAGADTPAVDLARATRSLGASLVVLSATLVSQRHALRAAVDDLRAVPGFDAPILVGGAAIPDERAARSVGADGYASNLTLAVQEANRLVGR